MVVVACSVFAQEVRNCDRRALQPGAAAAARPSRAPCSRRARVFTSWCRRGAQIKQDTKNGALREYKWGDMLFNYGAFPQVRACLMHAYMQQPCNCGVALLCAHADMGGPKARDTGHWVRR